MPNLITEFATPYERKWRLNELGIYAQDKWTVGRLTANAGLRCDYFTTTFPEAHLGPGTLRAQPQHHVPRDAVLQLQGCLAAARRRLRPVRQRPDRPQGEPSAVTWSGIVPTNGHPVTNLASQVTRTWTDANRDYVPDCDLLNPQQNGECGIISDLTFGSTRPSTAYDPAILTGAIRGSANWEFSGGVQHQLVPRRRPQRRLLPPRRTPTSPSPTTAPWRATDYTAFGFTAPVDARLPGAAATP